MRMLALAGVLFLTGQIGSAPPMKMGLWETTTVMTTTYPPNMASLMGRAAGPSGQPMTMNDKTCFTMEKWQHSLGMKAYPKTCNVSKHDYSGNTLTVSMTCTFGSGTSMAIDSTETFDSSETMHGTAHAVTTFGSSVVPGGGKTVADSKTTGKYVGSDCGSVDAVNPAGSR
jgi:hypothetical protein